MITCKEGIELNLSKVANSTTSIAIADLVEGETGQVTLSNFSLLDHQGNASTDLSMQIVGSDLVIVSGSDASNGVYTLSYQACDEDGSIDDSIQITAPAGGATIAGTTTVSVSSAGPSQWRVVAGSTAGASNYYDSGLQAATATSVSATGWPEDGSAVYFTATKGAAADNVQVASQDNSAPVSAPEGYIAIPANSSTVAEGFSIEPSIQGGNRFTLEIGTSIEGDEIFSIEETYTDNDSINQNFQYNITGLPTDGSTLYASFRMYNANGDEHVKFYQYTAPTTATSTTINWADPLGQVVPSQIESLYEFTISGVPISNNAVVKFGSVAGADDLSRANDSVVTVTAGGASGVVNLKRPVMTDADFYIHLQGVNTNGDSYAFARQFKTKEPPADNFFYVETDEGVVDFFNVASHPKAQPLNIYVERRPVPDSTFVTARAETATGAILESTTINDSLSYVTVDPADMAALSNVHVTFGFTQGGTTSNGITFIVPLS